MKRLEIGVFLPIGKNGFIRSTNAPAYEPSYRDLLEITRFAEQIGLDYVFSMAKWRGVGGKTRYWDASLESFSLTAALAAATQRIELIATVNPLLFHPAMMAKMAATVDDVSGGRLGLNIITGAVLGEYEQMGIVPEGYDQARYEYAAEWAQVLKRLWTEPRVTHHGKHFHLEDCVSEPKPVQRPHPFLVCAASSEEGLRFTARHADYSFINGKNVVDLKQKALRTKQIAAEEGTILKTAVPQMIVIGDTLADAEAYWDHLVEGADVEAIDSSGRIHSSQTRAAAQTHGAAYLADRSRIHSSPPTLGSPRQIADVLIGLSVDAEIDSVLLVFSDYMAGLKRFDAEVMRLLREQLDVGVQPTTRVQT